MKIATSYFYQIRNFKPYMIPISTALYDPAWYRAKKPYFIDKNGVINGLRAESFTPPIGYCEGACSPRKPEECEFLKVYYEKLRALDVEAFFQRASANIKKIKEILGFEEEPILVFIVHEAPWNKCSERVVIQKYFRELGYECNELIL